MIHGFLLERSKKDPSFRSILHLASLSYMTLSQIILSIRGYIRVILG